MPVTIQSEIQIVILSFIFFAQSYTLNVFFLCTLAATFNRSALNRMKPAAASWLWSRKRGIGSAFIMAIISVRVRSSRLFLCLAAQLVFRLHVKTNPSFRRFGRWRGGLQNFHD